MNAKTLGWINESRQSSLPLVKDEDFCPGLAEASRRSLSTVQCSMLYKARGFYLLQYIVLVQIDKNGIMGCYAVL